jgi:hypothetical protein
MHYLGWSRAQRRTLKEMRARRRAKNDDRRLKGAFERRQGLESALKMMIKGSKTHLKEIRLEGALERR